MIEGIIGIITVTLISIAVDRLNDIRKETKELNQNIKEIIKRIDNGEV